MAKPCTEWSRCESFGVFQSFVCVKKVESQGLTFGKSIFIIGSYVGEPEGLIFKAQLIHWVRFCLKVQKLLAPAAQHDKISCTFAVLC